MAVEVGFEAGIPRYNEVLYGRVLFASLCKNTTARDEQVKRLFEFDLITIPTNLYLIHLRRGRSSSVCLVVLATG
jgi:hypothetical protein